MNLLQILYIPSFFHSLVSLTKFAKAGFSFKFGYASFILVKNNFIHSEILCDGPRKFKLDYFFDETLITLHHYVLNEV